MSTTDTSYNVCRISPSTATPTLVKAIVGFSIGKNMFFTRMDTVSVSSFLFCIKFSFAATLSYTRTTIILFLVVTVANITTNA